MRLLRRLEQTLGPYALPHLTIAIIAVQVLVFVVIQIQPNPQKEDALKRLLLVPDLVLQGEWWRMLTFVAVPSVSGESLLGPIWAFFAWYIFYLMGTSLERYWGTLRYNLYLLVGYIATVAASFVSPHDYATNFYFLESVFLAFAFLFPEFEFLIFFILPVKVKWLALLQWIIYGYLLLTGDWMIRVLVVAAISNFLLFFWRDILERLSHGRRRMSQQAKHYAAARTQPAYRHRCTVCGVTDKSNPEEDFRYCSKCAGQYAYCSKHLKDHEHVVEAIVSE
jgi:hypothetical protein